jgi:hypothetical protein
MLAFFYTAYPPATNAASSVKITGVLIAPPFSKELKRIYDRAAIAEAVVIKLAQFPLFYGQARSFRPAIVKGNFYDQY